LHHGTALSGLSTLRPEARPEKRAGLKAAMSPLKELGFGFDLHGSSIIFVDNQ